MKYTVTQFPLNAVSTASGEDTNSLGRSFAGQVDSVHQNEHTKARCCGCFDGVFKAISNAATRIKLWFSPKMATVQQAFTAFKNRITSTDVGQRAQPQRQQMNAVMKPYNFTGGLGLAGTVLVCIDQIMEDLSGYCNALASDTMADRSNVSYYAQAIEQLRVAKDLLLKADEQARGMDGFARIADTCQSINTPLDSQYYSTQFFIDENTFFTQALHEYIDPKKVVMDYKNYLMHLADRTSQQHGFPGNISKGYLEAAELMNGAWTAIDRAGNFVSLGNNSAS